MDDTMAIYLERWDILNMPHNVFGIGSDMFFPKLYKFMVNKVTFIGFREGGWSSPLNQPQQ